MARDYLCIDFDLPAPWDGSIDVEPLLHDSLCGGVYGSNDLTHLHSATVTLNAVKASRTGEKSGVLRTVCRDSRTTPVRSSPAQTAAPPVPSSSPRSALS